MLTPWFQNILSSAEGTQLRVRETDLDPYGH